MIRCSSVAAVCLFVSSPALCLQQPWGTSSSYAWPASTPYQGSSADGPFHRGVAGEFTGDLVPDACIIKDRLAVLAFDPARYGALVRLPMLANDVAVLPAGSGFVSRDTILVVNDDGLSLCPFDTAGAEFDTPVAIESSLWDGARLVRVSELDLVAGHDIVGVMSDGLTVRALSWDGDSFESSTSFQMTDTVLDVLPIEWDGDAGRELVLRTTAGIQVRERAGSVVVTVPHVASGGAIAVLHVPEHSTEWLAWITATSTPGEQSLYVVDHGIVVDSYLLGALDVVACAAADLEGDGDDDLFLSNRLTHGVVRMRNVWDPQNPTAAPFSTEATDVINVGWPGGTYTAAPANQAQPVLCDFDGDGSTDLYFPVDGGVDTLPDPDEAVAPYLQLVRQVVPDRFHATVDTFVLYYDDEIPEIGLRFTANMPPVLDPLSPDYDAGVAATHLEVTVWRQPVPTKDGGTIDADAVGLYRFAIAGGWPLEDLSVTLPEVPDARPLEFPTIYKLEFGLVNVSGTPARTTRVYPVWSGALAATEIIQNKIKACDPYDPEGDCEEDSGDSISVFDDMDTPPQGILLIEREDAEVVKKPNVTPFGEDEVPKPPQPQGG